MIQHSISVTRASNLKGCSRQTVYANMWRLTTTEDKRVIPDERFDAWQPDKRKGRLKIILDPKGEI